MGDLSTVWYHMTHNLNMSFKSARPYPQKGIELNKTSLKKGLISMLYGLSDYVLYFSDEMRYKMMSNFRRSSSDVGERASLDQNRLLLTVTCIQLFLQSPVKVFT